MNVKCEQRHRLGRLGVAIFLLALLPLQKAVAISFTPRELFRVMFGNDPDNLKVNIYEGDFVFPRKFIVDPPGQFFYIDDLNNHRIVKFNREGQFLLALRYPASVERIDFFEDGGVHLLMIQTDPRSGYSYSVFDDRSGDELRHESIPSRFKSYRLWLDLDHRLHVTLFETDQPTETSPREILIYDSRQLRLRPATPQEDDITHTFHFGGRTFYVEEFPSQGKRWILDQNHKQILNLYPIFICPDGTIYMRISQREINVYNFLGNLTGKIILRGEGIACGMAQFDANGDIYVMDQIPDLTDEEVRYRNPSIQPNQDWEDLHYDNDVRGVQIIEWQKQ